MGKSKKNRYTRNEQGRITQEYIKAYCHLTEREQNLLHLIAERKFVRRDSLEIISPDYRHAGAHRTRIINRALERMFQLSIIDKVQERAIYLQGSTPMIVAVDKAGSYLLGVTHKTRIPKTKHVKNGETYYMRDIPLGFFHAHGVNSTEVAMIQTIEGTDYTLTTWKIEPRLNWVENGTRSEKLLIPDAFFMLTHPNYPPITGYLEYDTGKENRREKEPKILREKIQNYRSYFQTNQWKETSETMPLVLFVTEDKKRIPFWNETCEKNGVFSLGTTLENVPAVLQGYLTLQEKTHQSTTSTTTNV